MTALLCLLLFPAQPTSGGVGGVGDIKLVEPYTDCETCAHKYRILASYHPQAGDLILFRKHSVTANVAYHLAFSGGATHVAIVVHRADGKLVLLETPIICARVMMNDIVARLRFCGDKTWVRRRRIPLTPDQSTRLTTWACAQDGKPYDLAGLLIPPFTSPTRLVGKRCLTPEDLNCSCWFCSSLVLAGCIIADLVDPCLVKPHSACANDLLDDKKLDLSQGWEEPIQCLYEGPWKKIK